MALAARFARIAGVVVLLAALPWVADTLRPAHVYTTAAETDAWLAAHRDDYEQAVAKARRWLEPLAVDPIELRALDIKGKKKLVELIDAWIRLHEIADPADKPGILAHIDALAEVTRTERYHDMLDIDDVWFKQDATSYLRAAYLLDRVGVDTTLYREHIARALPRLNGHMHLRGPHQRYAFRTYYAYFGLAEPFPLEDALQHGLIAARTPPSAMDRMDAYGFTHEIFAPYDYGDQLDATPFDDADLRYVRATLSALVTEWIRRRDPDLVAELVSCLRYVRATDLPAYTDGLGFLLRTQQPDGHWGDYQPHVDKYGARSATYKLELHATAVALDALTVAFHRPWNQGVVPVVPAE